ncbi:MAG: lactate utilization protein C [Gracilibacter sp. BRH_c7a]|nr:MAG: lactate utilization protein C [Gracilibacter sp. BRH_c7a]
MSRTDELKDWHYEKRCLKAIDALSKNGFTANLCETKQDAIDYVLNEAATANTIGLGGSLSLADLKLPQLLESMKKELLIPNKQGLSNDEKLTIMHRHHTCDLFLSSANSVTETGIIVLMESTGNRISSILFGPKKVILVAGRNKITQDTEDAMRRIKKMVSPANCKRLNYNTPCVITGICADCNSPDRSCRITTILERKPKLADIHILVVNEDLGL